MSENEKNVFKIKILPPGVPEGAASVDGQKPTHPSGEHVVGSIPDALFIKKLPAESKLSRINSELLPINTQETQDRSTSNIDEESPTTFSQTESHLE
jgi:hypothetical protein